MSHVKFKVQLVQHLFFHLQHEVSINTYLAWWLGVSTWQQEILGFLPERGFLSRLIPRQRLMKLEALSHGLSHNSCGWLIFKYYLHLDTNCTVIYSYIYLFYFFLSGNIPQQTSLWLHVAWLVDLKNSEKLNSFLTLQEYCNCACKCSSQGFKWYVAFAI